MPRHINRMNARCAKQADTLKNPAAEEIIN
jgi:hypothetical protein